MFFLLALLAVITIGSAIGFVMVIGKFAKLEREHTEVFENLAGGIEEIHGVITGFLEDFKNLKTEVETLVEADPKNLRAMVESWDIEGVFTQLDELAAKESITRQDVNLLLRAGDEHPVTAVLEPARNKGGRPKKVSN